MWSKHANIAAVSRPSQEILYTPDILTIITLLAAILLEAYREYSCHGCDYRKGVLWIKS